MEIYDRLVQAGIEVHNHYSDLMCPKTEESTKIIKECEGVQYETFTNQLTGTTWYYIPFEYLPYWESKRK